MNYGYMLIYKKQDGTLLYRAVKNRPMHNKGDKTSMGWYVVDIQRLYDGKCYSTCDFDMLLKRKHKVNDILVLFDRLSLIDTLKALLLIMGIVYLFVK